MIPRNPSLSQSPFIVCEFLQTGIALRDGNWRMVERRAYLSLGSSWMTEKLRLRPKEAAAPLDLRCFMNKFAKFESPALSIFQVHAFAFRHEHFDLTRPFADA